MEDFWSPLQEIITEVCINFDNKWRIRKRVIDSHFLVLFILKLVLSKNSQGYKSLLNELWEKQELAVYQKTPISSSTVCEARQKLPEEIFIELNQVILSKRARNKPLPRWCGHRVFAADGSKINLPHELLEVGYKAPNREQHYPQGLMSTIYHLGSGLVYDCLLSAEHNERDCVIEQMDKIQAGDVLVLDRGYFSYLLLYKATEKGINLICRLSTSGRMNGAIKIFYESDLMDTVIDYNPSASRRSELKNQGYNIECRAIRLRLIKYQIKEEIYLCATTLTSDDYPREEFAHVYHGRWGIEELYKISKEFINVEDFHSKTERGVKQELYAHMLLINIARIFELEADDKFEPPSGPNPTEDKESSDIEGSYWQDFCGKVRRYKINFKNCLLVIGRYIEKLIVSSKPENESWVSKILNSISRVRQKIRPERHYPRRSRKPHTRWQSSNVAKITAARA